MSNTNLPPAVFLMGPTASGKTDLALTMAKRWPFEVISVDSALIYRGMNIGTAKPDADFLKQLPHHLIDIRDPDQSYSVAEFRRDALQLMHKITEAGNIPLLVGGTMLYFKALFEGLADLPATDKPTRQKILQEAQQVGWPGMHQKLQEIDPVTAEQLHPNHSQRISRALEVYYMSGETMSSLQAQHQPGGLPYQVLQFALWPEEREQLHCRIAKRFDLMMQSGFIDEMQILKEKYTLSASMPSMRAVGYRQAWEYLEGQLNEAEFEEKAIAATRQLAKRQLTWLRKWQDVHYLNVNFESKEPVNSENGEVFRNICELIPAKINVRTN